MLLFRQGHEFKDDGYIDESEKGGESEMSNRKGESEMNEDEDEKKNKWKKLKKKHAVDLKEKRKTIWKTAPAIKKMKRTKTDILDYIERKQV